jgi:CheY-like chemotaxis protein
MPKRILVADDSRTIQRAIAIALSDEDLALVEVLDPGMVVNKARESKPDLILLDYHMNRTGNYDGYDICKQIKSDELLALTPVVFLGGSHYHAELGQAAGGLAVIDKPFECKDFSEKVCGLLDVGKLETQIAASTTPEPLRFVPNESIESAVPTPVTPTRAGITPAPSLRETMASPAFAVSVNFQSMLPENEVVEETDVVAFASPPPVPNVVVAEDLLPASVQEDLQRETQPLFSSPPERSSPKEPPSAKFTPRRELTPPPLPVQKPLQTEDDEMKTPAQGTLVPPPLPFATPVSPKFTPSDQRSTSFTPPPLPQSSSGVKSQANQRTPPPLPSVDTPKAEAMYSHPATDSSPMIDAPEMLLTSTLSARTKPFTHELKEREANNDRDVKYTPVPTSAQRRSPLIIPSPSDEPQDFPVKDFLALHQQDTDTRANTEDEDMGLVMDNPSYLEKAHSYVPTRDKPISTAAAASTQIPSFALDPQRDYLARALQNAQSWRKVAAVPTNPTAAMQMKFIRQLSSEIIERVAWEVVPELTEVIIRDVITKYNERRTGDAQ